jgi:DNA-binding LacI/PurR family transcriptional regulator
VTPPNVRLEDVARLARVSRATASRVLNDAAGPSANTRDAVRTAAAELGYELNPVARALATGAGMPAARQGCVVVAVVGADREVLRDAYVATVVAAIAELAGRFGAGVGLEWLPLSGSRALRDLAVRPDVRGVLLINTTHELLTELPPGLVGRVASIGVGSRLVPNFEVDSAGAAEAVVAHLIRSGRRTPVMLTGPRWLPCTHQQWRRYQDVMTDAGLEPRMIEADFTSAAGAAAMTQALQRWPGTDAVFATCDAAAFGAVGVLLRRGVRVPHDVAVAGFDDVPFAGQSTPALTTATHPVAQMAATAALSLLDPTTAADLPHRFRSELVLRESA